MQTIIRVICFMLVANLFTALLSGSKYAKYCKWCIGMLCVLLAVSVLNQNTFRLQDIITYFPSLTEISAKQTEVCDFTKYEALRSQTVHEAYETQLMTQVERLLRSMGQELTEIHVTVSESFGEIESLTVILAPHQGSVSINDIKKQISDFYNLEETNINVYIREGTDEAG